MRAVIRSTAARLTVSFLLVILAVSAIFSIVGINVINGRIEAESHSRVEMELASARGVFGDRLADIKDVVRLTAGRFFLRNALLTSEVYLAASELTRIADREGFGLLTVTDAEGRVLLRVANPENFDEVTATQRLVAAARLDRAAVAGTELVPVGAATVETGALPACGPDAPGAEGCLPGDNAMMMLAAAPILDYRDVTIGILYGGKVVNGAAAIADDMSAAAFGGERYGGRPIGTATVFQGDVAVAVTSEGSPRSVGALASPEVHGAVVERGGRWVGTGETSGVAYIEAYEPIRDRNGAAIGMLHAGTLSRPYADLQHRTALTFLAITLGGAAGVMILSLLMSRRISRPIRGLVDASREVAVGNFDVQVPVPPEGELAEFSRAFNSMALALKERIEHMRDFARSRIQESERLAVIGQLSAGVAHELNNPLQGIVGYAHLALEQTPETDPRRDDLTRIVAQADRCTAIIRALLDFSRPRELERRRCDLNAVVAGALSLVGGQALFHDIEVVPRLSAHLPTILADPSQMEQVFVNLLINAAEAMEEGGHLTVSSRFDAADGSVVVEVADTGHGIAPDDLKRVFDPFFSTKDVMHGTGLGLAISHGIVREHGGAISVTSKPGSGATFAVRLPITADRPLGETGDQT
jgi:two-component system NtrC family sensor kinase